MYGWAFVAATAVTLILTLDVPFRGGFVNREPLITVSDSLIAEPLTK